MNAHIAGPYCPVSSYLAGKLKSKWVPSDQVDVAATFARVRSQRPYTYIADAYADVERDHHLMFIGGFK